MNYSQESEAIADKGEICRGLEDTAYSESLSSGEDLLFVEESRSVYRTKKPRRASNAGEVVNSDKIQNSYSQEFKAAYDHRKAILIKIIADAERRLQFAPAGSLYRRTIRGKIRYYLRNISADKTAVEKYLGHIDEEVLRSLLQKEYDTDLLRKARAELQSLEALAYAEGASDAACNEDALCASNPFTSLESLYSGRPEQEKALLNPVLISDADYTAAWLAASYTQKEFDGYDKPAFYTSSGETVRSKSEIIIADALKNAGIPYRYECALHLGDIVLHPDFTVLKPSTRQTFYWEHFGMMDDPKYACRAVERIALYQQNGIMSGIQLITTFETADTPLNASQVKELIHRIFG